MENDRRTAAAGNGGKGSNAVATAPAPAPGGSATATAPAPAPPEQVTLDLSTLKEMSVTALTKIAREHEIPGATGMRMRGTRSPRIS